MAKKLTAHQREALERFKEQDDREKGLALYPWAVGIHMNVVSSLVGKELLEFVPPTPSSSSGSYRITEAGIAALA